MLGLRFIAIIAAVSLVGADSLGSTSRALTLADLVFESDAIVRCFAIEQRVERDPQLGIVRVVRVTVDEWLLGDAATTLEVVLLGGELDGAATLVPGEAQLRQDEEVVLFLALVDEKRERYRVVGMEQGAFRVLREDSTGAVYATRTLGYVGRPTSSAEDRLGIARGCSSNFIALEIFRQAIVDLLEYRRADN